MTASEYESFSEVYSIWTDTAASARANLAFYLDAYARTRGVVVELGVGNGRIAIPAAATGRDITGVDLSPAMLDLCRARATQAGVLDRLTLIESDFRRFTVAAPAALITLPYHSLGHLLTLDEKRDALRQVWSQLQPGGRFIFDDFFMTPALIANMRRVQLRAEYRSGDGADTRLWVTSLVDEALQSIRVITWADVLDAGGALAGRQYRRLSLSWITPAQAREMLVGAGFVIDACYGDFTLTPFAVESASEQVWIAHRPQ